MLTHEEIVKLAGSSGITFVNIDTNPDYSIILPRNKGRNPVSGCILVINEDFISPLFIEMDMRGKIGAVTVRDVLELARSEFHYSDKFIAVIFGLHKADIERFNDGGFCPPYVEHAILSHFVDQELFL
jgi:hypothetical protein